MARNATKTKQTKSRHNARGHGFLYQRNGIWYLRIQRNNKRITVSTGTTSREEAEAFAQRMAIPAQGLQEREAIRKLQQRLIATLSDQADAIKLATIPIGQLYPLFRESKNRRPVGTRTLASYEGQFNQFAKFMAARHPEIRNLRDVSQTVADEYIEWRQKHGKSASSLNKDMNLFAYAWTLLGPRYGLEYTPWTKDKMARAKCRQIRREPLTRDEFERVWRLASTWERCFMGLNYLAGYSLIDITIMRWDSIDLPRKWISINRHKSGIPENVPIPDRLADILAVWRRESAPCNEYVFPDQIRMLKPDHDTERLSRHFSRLFELAGIKTYIIVNGRRYPYKTFHSGRHSLATNMMAAGVHPFLIRETLGHSVMATTMHYTHIGEAQIRAALNAAAGTVLPAPSRY